MRVVFTTNLQSAYRVDFFNELGKYCDLTVLYELDGSKERNAKWFGGKAEFYNDIHLNSRPFGTSFSIDTKMLRYVAKNKADVLVFGGYASPSVILSILFCIIFRKRYFIEFDGGFNKKNGFLKGLIKKILIKGAVGNFITCNETEMYLRSINVPPERIIQYPFTSVKQSDIYDGLMNKNEKIERKKAMGIIEEVAIVSVGRFVYGKGFDILLEAAVSIPKNVGIYIIGGEPTKEYIDFCYRNYLDNVHFISFCEKKELFKWYLACDFFVFPTREDIWGLVVNEAMACGLPVISSDKCIAGVELIEPGYNGYLFKSEDKKEMLSCIEKMLTDDSSLFFENCISTIKKYTIEEMVRVHVKEWVKYENINK